MLINNQLLTDLNACESQRKLFNERFPKGVRLTRRTNVANLLPKLAGLDLEWAATHLLTTDQLAEYERVRGPALAEYERVSGAAWAEYERVRGAAWAEYERVRGPALAEYERVRGAALINILINK